MRIKQYVNTTKDEVESKKHNIWIGVSLGNKYFTKENIRKYIEWALQHTKDGVLVLIADDIYAINIEILDGRSKARALKRAYRLADEKQKKIEEILSTLPKDEASKVTIARWKDVSKTKYHEHRLEVVRDAFKNNKEFHDYVYSIIKEGRPDRNLDEVRLESLSEYVLHEIPVFINGTKYQFKNGEWKTYTLIPYPGLTKLDKLIVGLSNKTLFSEIAEKLKVTNEIAILEAYVN
ncbi:tRNA-dependent cyclodipeptide synthase [bacterium]|nr:tRNA-dependent cyclodipeptide synthase [bacterium]MBT3729993.1 tRNA-dependent cyclodipeptide synthase [bacterium]MBT4894537.1 tRNA-dependent cyclodipeptide synthase [bacterium]